MSGPSYFYDVAGLGVASDCQLQLPSMPELGGTPDIVIRRGPIDASALRDIPGLGGWQIDGGLALLTVPEVGRFLLVGDREVVVEAVPGATDAMVRSFLAGSVFGALCHRRGILPLHASAVETVGDGVAAFVGKSGAGKSTMLAALARRGHRVLTDDVCFLRVGSQGEARIWPGVSRIRLWQDSLEALAFDRTGAERVGRRVDKFEVYPQQPAVQPRPRRLRRVFVLSAVTEPDEEGFMRLSGAAALDAIWRNIYRPGLARRLGREAEVFAAAGRIAADVEVFEFRRIRDFARLDRTVSRIEAYLSLPGAEALRHEPALA
ncbi:MAG TPA: hypothetical protein VKQ29_14850 [Aliidongia sp.]|nr:hypothetical protein [Aliidongia sp.]